MHQIVFFSIPFTIICLIIAIPCWLYGDLKVLRHDSSIIHSYTGTVIKSYTRYMNSRSKFWKGYCVYQYDGSKTCTNENYSYDGDLSKTQATKKIHQDCPINSTRTIYDENGYCTFYNNEKSYGIVGFVFFILAGCSLLVSICGYFISCKKIDKNNTFQPDQNNYNHVGQQIEPQTLCGATQPSGEEPQQGNFHQNSTITHTRRIHPTRISNNSSLFHPIPLMV
jgi:hypothetical protein